MTQRQERLLKMPQGAACARSVGDSTGHQQTGQAGLSRPYKYGGFAGDLAGMAIGAFCLCATRAWSMKTWSMKTWSMKKPISDDPGSARDSHRSISPSIESQRG